VIAWWWLIVVGFVAGWVGYILAMVMVASGRQSERERWRNGE
jgi:hypothetical protein